MKIKKFEICFAVAILLWLCNLKLSGQEPDSISAPTVFINDSIDFANDSIDFFYESDIIFISDTTDWATIFPVESMESYSLHSPAKAAMMSAVIPGLGQVYNRKYWKIPIIYLAIGISVERLITFQNMFSQYRRAYIDYNDNDPYTNYHEVLLPGFTPARQSQIINTGKDKLRTWRDWAIVAVVASYAVNIIDANVDAHLMDFNIDDNISLKIRPIFFDNFLYSQNIGLSLRFYF